MTPVPSSPVALLDQLDELRAKATPGPWFFNGYSAVMSQPRLREYNDAESLLPEDAPDDAYDGLPEYITATVPIAGGDTATRQGGADAKLIVAAVNAVGPLTAAVRAVLELHRPVGGPSHYDGDESDYCDNDGFIWPCVTFTAVTAALSVTP